MTDRIDLTNLIIDKIEDKFYNGYLFGLKLIIDITTGYFNATNLCNSVGKKFLTWKTLHEKFIKFVYIKLGKHPIMYRYNEKNQTIVNSGDFVCGELLLNIASWAYPDYYLKFNNIVIYEAEKLEKSKLEPNRLIVRTNFLNNLITDKIEGYFYNADLFGLKLIIDITTGCFNATKFCDSAGKKFLTWLELSTSRTLQNFIFDKFKLRLVYHYEIDKKTTVKFGAYACSELLLNVASWAYPETYLKFNNVVVNEAKRIKLLLDNGKTINNKLDRILFQLNNNKEKTKVQVKIELECATKCDKGNFSCVKNCITNKNNYDIKFEINTKLIDAKLDKILFQLEKRKIN